MAHMTAHMQRATPCLFRNTPGTCEHHEVVLRAAEVLLHAVKKGPSSLAQDAGNDKADFPNGSKKRLDKSTENSSAPAELKQGVVCPLGALWLCGRVKAAGLQEHCEAAAGFPFLQCSATALGKGGRVHGHSKNAARG